MLFLHLLADKGEELYGGLIEMAFCLLAFAENVEGRHHVEHATEQQGKLTHAEYYAQQAVEKAQLESLDGSCEHVGHKAKHQRQQYPKDKEHADTQHHIGFATSNGQKILTPDGIDNGGDYQTRDNAKRGKYFLYKTIVPAVVDGPDGQDTNKKVNIHI